LAVAPIVAFARRLDAEFEISENYLADLRRYIDAYDRGGGVEGSTKNLIFAANGPKPDIVLRDAISNDIEIVANSEHCLVYDRPDPGEGLRFSHLIQWWRDREELPKGLFDERTVGLELHKRFIESLGSEAEKVVFEVYASRYRTSFDIPALIPQVYLHYDPYDQRTRRGLSNGTPLARQRMDFLLLFWSSRWTAISTTPRATSPSPRFTRRWSPRTGVCSWLATRSTGSGATSSPRNRMPLRWSRDSSSSLPRG
jgi:hypothetical protein